MILVVAAAVAVLSGAGVYLMLRHDLVKLIAGTLVISNAAVLFLISAAFGARREPIEPTASLFVADPVAQALALTAVVITFAVTALLLAVGLAVERSHRTIDLDAIARAEEPEEPERAPEEGA